MAHAEAQRRGDRTNDKRQLINNKTAFLLEDITGIRM
jgi:hypothetical protein